MGDRYFCSLHQSTMTRSRQGHCCLVWSCETCVAEARAIVRPLIAAYEAKRTKLKVWPRNMNSERTHEVSAIRR
jgi:hypothetical protein